MSASSLRYRRARHLIVRWEGDSLVLVNSNALRRFSVDAALLSLLAKLEGWMRPEELVADGQEPSLQQLERLVEMGILERGTGTEAADGDLWEPTDLAVHRASNRGGYSEDSVRGKGAPPAAFKPRPLGPTTPLGPARELPLPVGEAIERRRSVRRYADEPLSLEQLSTVLYHAARVVHAYCDPVLGEHALRPYAAGGARSELEVYVIANDIEGLPAQAHYYDAREHQLIGVGRRDEDQERLNRWVQAATGGALTRDPPALLVITAVFARIMWKYRGISLPVIYKNTGCLIQTLYLVATALDLAPCAVATADEEVACRWLGLDPLIESPVACFLLGRPLAGKRGS